MKSLAFTEGQGFLIFIRTSPGRSEASSILIIVTDMSHTQLRKNNHVRRGYMTLRVEPVSYTHLTLPTIYSV